MAPGGGGLCAEKSGAWPKPAGAAPGRCGAADAAASLVLAGSLCGAGAGADLPASTVSMIGILGVVPAGACFVSPGVGAVDACPAPGVTVEALSGASLEARCAASAEGEAEGDAEEEPAEAPGEPAGGEDEGAPAGSASAGRLAPSGTSGWSDLLSLMTWGQARGARTNEQGLIIRRAARRRHPRTQLLTSRHTRGCSNRYARCAACSQREVRHPAARRRFRATRSASKRGSSRTSAIAAW